jgi:hypothetical protein
MLLAIFYCDGIFGCYKSYPLKEDLVLRFGGIGKQEGILSYGPPWAHYLGGYQDRLLGGPLGLPGLCYTAPEGVEHKDYTGVVLG